MFYYTDKGWRFRVDFDDFFCGYLRKFREPIITKMRATFDKGLSGIKSFNTMLCCFSAKAARDAKRSIETLQVSIPYS